MTQRRHNGISCSPCDSDSDSDDFSLALADSFSTKSFACNCSRFAPEADDQRTEAPDG